MKKSKNGLLIVLVILGLALFGTVAFIVFSNTQTVTAVVPNGDIKAGTVIDESMIKKVQVPAKTPEGFLSDPASIIGQKLKKNVSENNLLYVNDIVSSVDYKSEGSSIPKDYVITTISVDSKRALGGLIISGDTIDVLGVPKDSYKTVDSSTMKNYLGTIADHSYGSQGEKLYWVLSNVKVLDVLYSNPDEAAAAAGKDAETANSGVVGGSDTYMYVVALSYSDMKRLRLAEEYLDMWCNLVPSYNTTNKGPLFDQILDSEISELKDAQAQSQIKEEKVDAKQEEATTTPPTNQ